MHRSFLTPSQANLCHSHTEQLFPGQKLDVILNGAAPRSVEVVWCRRWSHNRYAIGCRFLGSSSAPADAATAATDAPQTAAAEA